MLDAYEQCEVTEAIVLDRVHSRCLTVIIEWCQAFPDAHDFEPQFCKFTQTYREFDYADGEQAFLEQHAGRLWQIAAAAEHLDASRLRFCALKFLEAKISGLLRSQRIAEARALLGLPESMMGAYQRNAYGQTAVFDKELPKALCCQLLRLASDHRSLQRWCFLSPDWQSLIIAERHRLPRRVSQCVSFTKNGVVAESNGTEKTFPHLGELSCSAIEELYVTNRAGGPKLPREVEDYVNFESAKLHVQRVNCSLLSMDDDQSHVFTAFIGRVLCLDELHMRIALEQMAPLTHGALKNGKRCIEHVSVDVMCPEFGSSIRDPFELLALVSNFYKAFIGDRETGSLEISFICYYALNLAFSDLLEAISKWFVLYGHFNVACTVYHVDCSLEQLDNFASRNGYRLTDSGQKRRCYECKQAVGRKMVLCVDSYGEQDTYTVEWTASRC